MRTTYCMVCSLGWVGVVRGGDERAPTRSTGLVRKSSRAPAVGSGGRVADGAEGVVSRGPVGSQSSRAVAADPSGHRSVGGCGPVGPVGTREVATAPSGRELGFGRGRTTAAQRRLRSGVVVHDLHEA